MSILGIMMMKPPWWMRLKNLMKLRIWKVLEDTLSRYASFFHGPMNFLRGTSLEQYSEILGLLSNTFLDLRDIL